MNECKELESKKRIIQMILTNVILLQSVLGGVHRDLKLANFVVSKFEKAQQVTVIKWTNEGKMSYIKKKMAFAVHMIDFALTNLGHWPALQAHGTVSTVSYTPPEAMFGNQTTLLHEGWDAHCLGIIIIEVLLGTESLFDSLMGDILCPHALFECLDRMLCGDIGKKQKHTRHVGEDTRAGLIHAAYKCMVLAHDSELNYVKALDQVYGTNIRDNVTWYVSITIDAESYSLLTGTKMSPLREALSSGGNIPANNKHPFSEPCNKGECTGLGCLLLSIHPDANRRPTPSEMGSYLLGSFK
jgi:serine/threonine protein kinase